jgi:hypothetical protein
MHAAELKHARKAYEVELSHVEQLKNANQKAEAQEAALENKCTH